MKFLIDEKLHKQLREILTKISCPHIDVNRIVCFRSFGSKSRAYARIWSLPHIWQMALNLKAHYCIEVLHERFGRLSKDEKVKVLIHELLHIPKNFSGALLPHRGRQKAGINRRNIEEFFKLYKKNKLNV